MSFEPIGHFAGSAARKYKLEAAANAGVVTHAFGRLIAQQYPDFTSCWHATKTRDQVLFVEVTDSAAGSELFLRTHEIIDHMNSVNAAFSLREIRIVRSRGENTPD